MNPSSSKPQIVILGAGFGGLYTVQHLLSLLPVDTAEITLINQTNYFLFTPMLHEVATGGVGHHQVVESIREIFHTKPVNILVTDVKEVDLEKKTINTKHGHVKFDYLVIALGSTTNFYNVPGAESNSITLKNLRDAISLRNRVIDMFEKASTVKDPIKRQAMLSFGIVGGGPTGVELVAELADLFWDNIIKMYPGVFAGNEIKLYLFSQAPDLLTNFEQSLRDEALRILRARGVDVHLATAIIEVKKDGVMIDGGAFLPMDTVIWAAGTTPNTPKFAGKVELDTSHRVRVDQYLNLPGQENVFALGDVASLIDLSTSKPIPMLAQVAVAQAKVVAHNVVARVTGRGSLRSYTYRLMGSLVSLGQWHAVAEIFGFKFSGRFAWYLWRTVYLFKFISWEKRFKIAADWTANIFSLRDITRA